MAADLALPEFEHPPVVETVLSVRFRAAAGLTTTAIVQFWEAELAERLPDVVEQAPYVAPIERLGPDGPVSGFQLQLEAAFPSPRFWFTGGVNLVQLQPDWCAFNWRQTDPADEYVRYTRTRQNFEDLLTKLQSFIEVRGGKFDPVQCEVTYVNHIPLLDGDLAHGPLGDVLRGIAVHSDRWLPAPETGRFATTYLMSGPDSGESVGRLHVVAESANLPPGRQPAVVLNLTARGRPLGPSVDDVLRFSDVGRSWVVQGFKDLTTELMHERWGLRGN
jgi:uncharacterized protein (TIGR04255 family)